MCNVAHLMLLGYLRTKGCDLWPHWQIIVLPRDNKCYSGTTAMTSDGWITNDNCSNSQDHRVRTKSCSLEGGKLSQFNSIQFKVYWLPNMPYRATESQNKNTWFVLYTQPGAVSRQECWNVTVTWPPQRLLTNFTASLVTSLRESQGWETPDQQYFRQYCRNMQKTASV
jgi:hypothetical protein